VADRGAGTGGGGQSTGGSGSGRGPRGGGRRTAGRSNTRGTGGSAQARGPASLYERYKDALRRGHVAALRGRLDAAIDAYGEASTIAPDRPLPHAAIGGILVRMGRQQEALAAFDRALALAPRDEPALRARADVLAELGRRVEAATTLDLLADMLEGAGRVPEASDAARRALELAESKDRRRHVQSLVVKLRESVGDEAERALAQVLHLLEPDVLEPGAAAEAVETPGTEPIPEPEAEPEPEPEPEPIDALAVGAAAEDALYAGDVAGARDGLLSAAAAHRAAGRAVAAVDACYLALAIAPADVDLHILLAELYLEQGWRTPAIDKLLLLGRLAGLAEDAETRARLCAVAAERLPGEPRLAELCASESSDRRTDGVADLRLGPPSAPA
jgi:tetratricopeptide (TPR) repeat protein